MNAVKIVALVVTVLWVLAAIGVGVLWMGQEYALIVRDNGNGTVTYNDGPDEVVCTHWQFFVDAVKNSLIIVFFFPTLPYLAFMLMVGIVWLFTKRERPAP